MGKHGYVMLESYRNELEQFNLQCWALTGESFFVHRRMDLAVPPFRLYRRLRIHLFRIRHPLLPMKIGEGGDFGAIKAPLEIAEIDSARCAGLRPGAGEDPLQRHLRRANQRDRGRQGPGQIPATSAGP